MKLMKKESQRNIEINKRQAWQRKKMAAAAGSIKAIIKVSGKICWAVISSACAISAAKASASAAYNGAWRKKHGSETSKAAA